jgi:P2-related tail formation protein
MATSINAFEFASLLSDALAIDPQVQAACAAIQSEFDAVTAALPLIQVIPNISIQPPAVLDNLAVAFDVWGYNQSLTNAQKVSLITNSIQYHQKIGTPWVIEQILATIFPAAQLFEWYQYGGTPYHFKLAMTTPPTGQQLTDMITAVLELKNVRSYFEGFEVLLSASGNEYTAGAIFTIQEWYVGGTAPGFPPI